MKTKKVASLGLFVALAGLLFCLGSFLLGLFSLGSFGLGGCGLGGWGLGCGVGDFHTLGRACGGVALGVANRGHNQLHHPPLNNRRGTLLLEQGGNDAALCLLHQLTLVGRVGIGPLGVLEEVGQHSVGSLRQRERGARNFHSYNFFHNILCLLEVVISWLHHLFFARGYLRPRMVSI